MAITRIAKIDLGYNQYQWGLYKKDTDVYFFRKAVAAYQDSIYQANFSDGSLTLVTPAYNHFGGRNTPTGIVVNQVYFLVEMSDGSYNNFYVHAWDYDPTSPNQGYHYGVLGNEKIGANLYPFKDVPSGYANILFNGRGGGNSLYVAAISYDKSNGTFSFTENLRLVTLYSGGTADGKISIAAIDHLPAHSGGYDFLANAALSSTSSYNARFGTGKLGFSPGVNITQLAADFIPSSIQGVGNFVYYPMIGQASNTATYFFAVNYLGALYFNRWTSGAPQDQWTLRTSPGGAQNDAYAPRGFAISKIFNKAYFRDYVTPNSFRLNRYSLDMWPPTLEDSYLVDGTYSLGNGQGITDIFIEEPYIYLAVKDPLTSDALYKLYDSTLDLASQQRLQSGGGREEEAYIMSILR